MSNINNFSLVGVGSSVRFGKANGFVSYTSGTKFSVLDASSALTNLSIADATAGTHAVTRNQLYNITGSNPLAAGLGLSFTAGTFATVVDGSTILNSGGTLHVGTVQTANIANNAITTALINNSAVTYAKIQNESASTILGNPTGSPAAPSEITLGSALSFTGSSLAVNVDGSSMTYSGNNLAVQLVGTGGIASSAAGLRLNLAGLAADGTALNSADFAAISHAGTTVSTTLGSLATFFAGASVFGTGAITATSGTIALVSGDTLSQAGGTLQVVFAAGSPIFDNTGLDVHVDATTIKKTGGTLSVGTISGNQVSGGTLLTTQITGLNNPVGATDAVNKNYVDGVAAGLDSKQSVRAATTGADLASTFVNNGGTGDTLTEIANGALVMDGVTMNNGDRVLVKNQTDPKQNGIYVVTDKGSAGTPFILTRTTDLNNSAQIAGAYTFVVEGTINSGIGYVVTGWLEANVIDTNAINWTQFSQAGAYGSATSGGLSLDSSSVPALFKVNFTNMNAAGALGTTDLVAISQDGTNVVKTTIGSLAAEIASASVFGTGAIHVASGTVSLVTSTDFNQTAGTLNLSNTGVSAATYGDNTHTAIVTVDIHGRITSASTGATTLGTGSVTSIATGTGLTGGPITNAGTVSVATNGITNALFRQSAATTIVGNAGTVTGNVADIAIGPGLILGTNGTLQMAIETLPNNNITSGTSLMPWATGTAGPDSYMTFGHYANFLITGNAGSSIAGGLTASSGIISVVASDTSISVANTGISVQYDTNSGLVTGAAGVRQQISNLAASAALGATDIIAVSQGGTTVRSTIGSLSTFQAGSGLTATSGVLSVNVDGTSIALTSGTAGVVVAANRGILKTASGLVMDIATLNTGTSAGANFVSIDNGGTTKKVTVSTLVSSVIVAQASAIQASVVADSATTSFPIGTLPTYGTLETAVARVIVNVGTAFDAATSAIVTAGAGTVMLAAENDINTIGIYVADLPMAFGSGGSAVTLVMSGGTATVGSAQVTVKFDLI